MRRRWGDGLMLVCAGAGGLGGLASPFALPPRVLAEFDGVIVLAEGVADGRGMAAAQVLGADLVCMGTPLALPDGVGTWSTVWSGGRSELIAEVPKLTDLVARLEAELRAAWSLARAISGAPRTGSVG